MTFLATTTVAVLRTVEVDALGDELDDNAAEPVTGLGKVPASIIERSKTVLDPATGTRRTVRVVTGRVRGNVELVEGDRIRDNRTGVVYAMRELTGTARGLSGQSSLTLDLVQV